MATYEKSLGYGMKCDTSEPDSPYICNVLFSSFTTVLNNLCKPLPILFAESSDPFHPLFVCLIQSRIFNLSSLVLSSGCIWFPYQMSSIEFVLIYLSSESSYIDKSSIEAKIDSSSSVLR